MPAWHAKSRYTAKELPGDILTLPVQGNENNEISIKITKIAVCEIQREKFYSGPGIEPGSLDLRAITLPLRYPGQLPIQGRINF